MVAHRPDSSGLPGSRVAGLPGSRVAELLGSRVAGLLGQVLTQKILASSISPASTASVNRSKSASI